MSPEQLKQDYERTLLRLWHKPADAPNFCWLGHYALKPDTATGTQSGRSPCLHDKEMVEGVVGSVYEQRRVEHGEQKWFCVKVDHVNAVGKGEWLVSREKAKLDRRLSETQSKRGSVYYSLGMNHSRRIRQ